MASIYDLVYDYMERIFPDEKINKEQKKTIHHEIKKLLNNGWCSSELYKHFKSYKGKPTTKAQVVVKGKKKTNFNLINPESFYYHNDLRLTSSPPKREIDYDSGEVIVINEPYFLEMKASYTIDDLVAYYMRQVGAKNKLEVNRYKGSFNWLLKSYKLEIILFMVDACVNTAKSEDYAMPTSPLDIQRYHKDAIDNWNLKRTETIQAGGNKIVRKKRTRSS